MTDTEERSAWSHRTYRPFEGSSQLGHREMQIDNHDEVEGLPRLVGCHVGNDPLDLRLTCEPMSLVDTDRGEVDSRHRPALASKPDGVPPLTASHIEGGSRRYALNKWRKEEVRFSRPYEVGTFVPVVPHRVVHGAMVRPERREHDGVDDRWNPLTVREVAERFAPFDVDWWIAGGRAIDCFLGWETRPHDDIDVEMFRVDSDLLFDVFAGWELFAVSEGIWTPWQRGEEIAAEVFGIWGRPSPAAPWGVEILLANGDRTRWSFRRDPAIGFEGDLLILRTEDGIPYCTPEVQLLYKAKLARPKDDVDLTRVLHRLNPRRRRWLASAIARSDPGHPWIKVLEMAECAHTNELPT